MQRSIKVIYEIILKDGNVVKGFAQDSEDILEMMLKHDIYIVAENNHLDKVTYIMPDKVSYFRFPKDGKSVAKPIT